MDRCVSPDMSRLQTSKTEKKATFCDCCSMNVTTVYTVILNMTVSMQSEMGVWSSAIVAATHAGVHGS